MKTSGNFDIIKKLCEGAEVAIFGTGASGEAAAALLQKRGIAFKFYAQNAGKSTVTKTHIFDESAAKSHRLVVYSPAFRPDHEWINLARANGATAICEPDLSALAWRGKIYAVTGTNGKTTLTSFLEKSLCAAGIKAISAGNIGKPLSAFCAEKEDTSDMVAVCELSSFQTSALQFLKIDALLWTNFAPDHLDWHKDMREYFAAKFNLVMALTGNLLFISQDVAEAAKEYNLQMPSFAKIMNYENCADCPPPFDTSVQARNFIMADAFLKSINLGSIARETAKDFCLAQYRFSKPVEVCGIKFYNDSKATNVHAAIAALRELSKVRDLVWIGGGKDKHCDLDELSNEILRTAKGAVLIGQTAEKLAKLLVKDGFQVKICQSMKEAVEESAKIAGIGGSVLFSPAFSSFGMFAGYADRGKSFQNEVLYLKNLK